MADITRTESVALTNAYDGWATERDAGSNLVVAAFRAGWAAGREHERQQQAAADARLIASTPDLLAALESLEAAIARARGEASGDL